MTSALAHREHNRRLENLRHDHFLGSGSMSVQVAVCDAAHLMPALEWLYRHLPAEDRACQIEAAAQELDPQNVVIATSCDRVVGLVVAQSARWRVGWVGCPVLDPSLERTGGGFEIAISLIHAAISTLAQAGTRLVQALIAPGDEQGRPLRAAGFVYITEIVRMRRSCGSPIAAPPDLPILEFLPYGPDTCDELAKVMERTYEGSLDLPELDGLRSIQEVIENYQGCGRFRPEHWLLARQNGCGVGCILLTDWPDESRFELQYMGVVPEARGRRIGGALCVHALHAARHAGAGQLCLSVDDRNWPAMKLYASLGFEETERRSLLIRKVHAGVGGFASRLT